MSSGKRLLYLTTVWPEYKASAAGVRSWQLLELFKRAGWQAACGSAAKDTTYRSELEERGFKTFTCPFNATGPMEAVLKDFNPDVVLFERFNIEEVHSWRVRQVLPGAVRVVDTQDLNHLRCEREVLLKQCLKDGVGDRETMERMVHIRPTAKSELLLRELAALHRSDGALIVSDFERDLLVEHYSVPPRKLELAPFFYDGKLPETGLIPFEARSNFVTIGNFRHRPNSDAARWLAAEIWPLVRRRLAELSPAVSAEMHVYGSYPAKADMQLTDTAQGFRLHQSSFLCAPTAGFIVQGPAKDQLKTLHKYRVLLAPLRFGAGIKGKISDAWSVGTPAITTSIGSEGMYGRGGGVWGGAVGWTVQELVEAAVDMYTDKAKWEAASAAGRALLLERFSTASGDAVVCFLDRLCGETRGGEGRDVHDFFQALLWREQTRCTEYFSKYLEGKKNNRPSA